jgi:hypothetical protein
MDKPKDILDGFSVQCARLQIDHDLFYDLFRRSKGRIDLFEQLALIFFQDFGPLAPRQLNFPIL